MRLIFRFRAGSSIQFVAASRFPLGALASRRRVFVFDRVHHAGEAPALPGKALRNFAGQEKSFSV